MSMKIDAADAATNAMLAQVQSLQEKMKAMSLQASPMNEFFNATNNINQPSEVTSQIATAEAANGANANNSISQMNASAQTQQINAGDGVSQFQALLKEAFENVNRIQNESASMQTRFDLGDRSISLADVMIASQKSSISFEATMQIRNKVVDAYKNIMQMPV